MFDQRHGIAVIDRSIQCKSSRALFSAREPDNASSPVLGIVAFLIANGLAGRLRDSASPVDFQARAFHNIRDPHGFQSKGPRASSLPPGPRQGSLLVR
eukprot:scaffold451192_cov35-Prasinocladus_malaysianus.AAC.1